MKKGQISIFIIAGIILISLFALGSFYVRNLDHPSVIEDNSAFEYVESCLRSTAIEGLNLQGAKGGLLYDSVPAE